jgi:hypothetical protein
MHNLFSPQDRRTEPEDEEQEDDEEEEEDEEEDDELSDVDELLDPVHHVLDSARIQIPLVVQLAYISAETVSGHNSNTTRISEKDNRLYCKFLIVQRWNS